MAYLTAQTRNNRTAIVGAVALLHGAAFYALITGFAVDVYKEIETIIQARNIPVEPPPAPPEPTATSDQAQVDTPRAALPKVPLERKNDALVVNLPPIPIPSPLPRETLVPALPSPSPGFAAKTAKPIGSPGRWATSDDYPAVALRQEREGTTRFRVIVGADGRVQACEVLGSSGSADLDAATCRQVSKRARFEPATDTSGERVVGSFTSAVKWVIPD